MAGSAAKNLAMLLATKTYKGMNSIGRAIRKVPTKMMDRIENVEKLKDEKNLKIRKDNFDY